MRHRRRLKIPASSPPAGLLGRAAAAAGAATDAIVGIFSPRAARHRKAERALASAGWRGADRTRPAQKLWSLAGGSPNAVNLDDLPSLREAANDLDRNNPIATGAATKTIECVVGHGLTLKSTIDADLAGIPPAKAREIERLLEKHWNLWAGSSFADLSQQGTFHDLATSAHYETFIEGDVLLRRRYKTPGIGKRRNAHLGTCFELIPAAQVCNRNRNTDGQLKDGPYLMAGCQLDADGTVTGYDVTTEHPDDAGADLTWTTIRRFDPFGDERARLLFSRRRAGQYRGIPALAPVVELFKQIGDITTAAAARMLIQSFFTVFIKSEAGDEFDTSNPSLELDQEQLETDEIGMGTGTMIPLQKGESVETAKIDSPGPAFEAFLAALLRQCGMAIGIPYELLVQHFQSSYSAARAAILEAWRHWRLATRWVGRNVYAFAYAHVVAELVDEGLVDLPGFNESPLRRAAYLGAEWTGQAIPQLDEVKAVTAAKLRVDGRFSNHAHETANLTGLDYEANINALAEEKAMLEAAGLNASPPPSPPAPPPSQNPEDEEDTPQDEENPEDKKDEEDAA